MSSSNPSTDNATNKLLDLLRKKEADKDTFEPEVVEKEEVSSAGNLDDAVLKYVFNDVEDSEMDSVDEFTETIVDESKIDDEFTETVADVDEIDSGLDFDNLVFKDSDEEDGEGEVAAEDVGDEVATEEKSASEVGAEDDSFDGLNFVEVDEEDEPVAADEKIEADEDSGFNIDFESIETSADEEQVVPEANAEEFSELSVIDDEADELDSVDEPETAESDEFDLSSLDEEDELEEPAAVKASESGSNQTIEETKSAADKDQVSSAVGIIDDTAVVDDDNISIPDEDDSDDIADEFEEDHAQAFVYNKTSSGIAKRFQVNKERIGFDIGTYALKYIKTLEAKNTYQIEEYGYFKYPQDVRDEPDRLETYIVQILTDIFAEKANKNARINIIAKGSDVGIKSIQMPKMAKKNMTDAVRWATQKNLSFGDGETITDYLITGEVEEEGVQKNEILVIAALDTLVHENIDRIPGKRIPHKVTLVPIALWHYVNNLYATVRKDNIMIIDIGHQTTMINVLNKRNLKFAREVGVAGREFTAAVAGSYINDAGERILVDEKDAEQLKIKYGVPDADAEDKLTEKGIALPQISSRLKQSVEKLISEIERSINFYTKEFALGDIEQIYLCGGSAALKNIDQLIHQALDIKTEVIDLMDQWTLGNYISDVALLQSSAPALVVPAGLAMDISPKLNLLPRELFHIVYSKYIKNALRFYAAAAAVVLFSVSTMTFIDSKSIKKDLIKEQETVNQLGPQQKKYLQYKDENSEISKKITILKKNLSETTIDDQVFIIMSNLMPENVILTSMNMDKRRNPRVTSVNFSGYIITDTYDANVKLAEFIYLLQNSAYMNNITLKKSQPVNFHSRTGIFFEIFGNIENYEA